MFHHYRRLLPIWTLFLAVGFYPAIVALREVPRSRDHVRDTCLLSIGAAILFIGIFVQLMKRLPAVDLGDPFVDVLAFPPGFAYLGTIVGFFWSVPAIIMLRRRPLAPAAKTILLTMAIAAVIFSMCAMPVADVEVLPILAALILGSVVFLTTCQILRRRLPVVYPLGHCLRCGYDLTGNVSGVCPECGVKIASDKATKPRSDEGWEEA